MKSPVVLLIFDVALAALGLLLAEQGRMVPALSIFVALAILGAWQLVLFTVAAKPTTRYKIEPLFRSTHYIQATLQATIYVYLSLYWDAIRVNVPLLLAQILLGYLFEILLAWSRGRPARLGFGTVPVILSTNLFLWFREDYYYNQFLMVAVAFFSKEFLTWNYDGRKRHIFNPSALPLSVASILIIATGTIDLTSAVDLVAVFDFAPNFYEVIFLLGLVTQALYLTTPVSLGTVVSMYILHYTSEWVLGEPIGDTAIHAQVFLGLTFLVTDPATSPKSNFGKFLFGLTYGLGVFALGILLRLVHQPGLFAKLLIVPPVNLMVPLFDRLTGRLEKFAAFGSTRVPGRLSRFGWLGAYIVLIVLILPDLKTATTKPATLLPKTQLYLSKEMQVIARNYFYCRSVYPQAYKPFGLLYEMTHLREIRRIYQSGPAHQLPSSGPPGAL
jgi:Na+-translocating ferredoxin:NAD+ oxidoreductase RnfD subunit